MNKFDSQSSDIHNSSYQTDGNLEASIQTIKKYEDEDQYSKNGFEKAVTGAAKTIDTHIDVGCGIGWLMIKTSPLFKKVIGIDPAVDGINIAKEITKDLPNVEFHAKDMITAIKELSIKEPVFLTTGIVLSHIKDAYVRDFLRLLNTLPNGSMFYFHEPYGTNVQQAMWHVRSEKWWSDLLEDWDLTFDDREGMYRNGINGKRVGKENKTKFYPMSFGRKISWVTEGLMNKVKRLGRFVKRKFK